MQLRQFLNRVKQRFLPVVSYDNKSGIETRTYLGHKKVYDFEGYLVSDTYQDRNYKIIQNYFPGTPRRGAHKHILNTIYIDKKTFELTNEVWYNLKGKRVAYISCAQKNAVLLLDKDSVKQATTLEYFDSKVQPLLDMVKKRTLIVNYDLRDISQEIDQTMAQMRHNAPLCALETSKLVDPKNKENAPAPAPVVEQVAPVKPKLTPEERKARWEERLQKRQEKHAQLLAMKAKVEASKRMNSDKKAERLASLDDRLTHNERAQHLLKTRLAALAAAQKRDEWKQIKASRQAAYHALQAKLKQKRAEFRATKDSLSKEELATYRQEVKQSSAEKKQALSDYRSAIKSTKLASIKTRKLKSTKRQKAIFDLNRVMPKDDILLAVRNAALNAQVRAVLNTFKAPAQKKQKQIRVADLKRAYQPLLPAFQNQNVKEAS